MFQFDLVKLLVVNIHKVNCVKIKRMRLLGQSFITCLHCIMEKDTDKLVLASQECGRCHGGQNNPAKEWCVWLLPRHLEFFFFIRRWEVGTCVEEKSAHKRCWTSLVEHNQGVLDALDLETQAGHFDPVEKKNLKEWVHLPEEGCQMCLAVPEGQEDGNPGGWKASRGGEGSSKRELAGPTLILLRQINRFVQVSRVGCLGGRHHRGGAEGGCRGDSGDCARV